MLPLASTFCVLSNWKSVWVLKRFFSVEGGCYLCTFSSSPSSSWDVVRDKLCHFLADSLGFAILNWGEVLSSPRTWSTLAKLSNGVLIGDIYAVNLVTLPKPGDLEFELDITGLGDFLVGLRLLLYGVQ